MPQASHTAADTSTQAPIFIVGCPRSGTTLLRDLLRSHPRLSFPPETHWVPLYYKLHGDPASERAARRLARAMLGLYHVRAWKLALTEDDLADCRSFAEMLSRLYGAWAAREGKPRWGDKTPQYVAEIPTLVRLFPHGQVLHVIRDGRDVARSWMQRPWGPRNLFSAAAGWRKAVLAGRQAASSLEAGRYLEVRYEALLADPEATLRAVCEFLQEPYDERVLSPTLMPAGYSGVLWQIPSRTPLSRIETGNSSKWKRDMPPAHRALFEWVAGDLLQQLAYETERLAGRPAWPPPSLPRIAWWKLHNALGCYAVRLRTAAAQRRLRETLTLSLVRLAVRFLDHPRGRGL